MTTKEGAVIIRRITTTIPAVWVRWFNPRLNRLRFAPLIGPHRLRSCRLASTSMPHSRSSFPLGPS